jgi:hypothetical protein
MTKPRLRFVSLGGIAPKSGAAELVASVPDLVGLARSRRNHCSASPAPRCRPVYLPN